VSTNLALATCPVCEWRGVSPDSSAGRCQWCEGEARVQQTLLNTEKKLVSYLYDTLDLGVETYHVHPGGLVSCAECGCVFVPGFDADVVLRYVPADDLAHLDRRCKCHSTPETFQ